MSKQVPSLGRVVHYQAFGTPGGEYKSVPRTALITIVNDADAGDVGLFIVNPTGFFFTTSVKYADPPQPGCWSWPPFVPPKGDDATKKLC